MRRLENLVKATAQEGDEATREADRVKLEFYLTPEGAALFQTATRLLCEEERRRLPAGDIFEWILADWLAGFTGVKRESVIEEARRDVETPWEATGAKESPCPGIAELQLASAPHWTQRIRFKPDSRHVTPAQRKLLLRRDGYRCSTPGCPNSLWLQMHHIVFYSAGGATVPENVFVCCSSCHRNIHDGHLHVRGRAPRELHWLDAKGQELGSPERVDLAPWMNHWWDTG